MRTCPINTHAKTATSATVVPVDAHDSNHRSEYDVDAKASDKRISGV